MKRALIIILVLALALIMLVPALAAADPGGKGSTCTYGEIHKGLATSGATGNRMNSGTGHIPGRMHRGAAGFCGLGVGAGGG